MIHDDTNVTGQPGTAQHHHTLESYRIAAPIDGFLPDTDPTVTQQHWVDVTLPLLAAEELYGNARHPEYRPVMFVRGNPIYYYGDSPLGFIIVYKVEDGSAHMVTDMEGFMDGSNKPRWEKRRIRARATQARNAEKAAKAQAALEALMAEGQLDNTYMQQQSLSGALALLRKAITARNGQAFKVIVTDLADRVKTGDRIGESRPRGEMDDDTRRRKAADRARRYRAAKKTAELASGQPTQQPTNDEEHDDE